MYLFSFFVKVKKLKKYAKEYQSIKEQQKYQEDPVSKLQVIYLTMQWFFLTSRITIVIVTLLSL